MNTQFNFFLSLIFVLVTYVDLTGQNKKNDLTENNIKGNVRVISSDHYAIEYKFGKIEKGDTRGYEIDSFNSNGMYVSEHEKFDDGIMVSFSTMKSKYNVKNELIERAVSNLTTVSLKYDINGNNTELLQYDSNGKLIYGNFKKYDNNSKVIESETFGQNSGELKTKYEYVDKTEIASSYSSDGTLVSITSQKYDDKGNVLEINDLFDKKGMYCTRENYQYNNYDLKIEWKIFDCSGQLISITNYEYDNQNNLTAEEFTHFRQNEYKNVTYTYEYDRIGNWVKRIKFVNDIPEIITEREIVYY